MADGGIGDATFSENEKRIITEVERRETEIQVQRTIEKSSSYGMRGKYDRARRRQYIAEDPVHGPVLATKDDAKLSATFRDFHYEIGGLLAGVHVIDILQKGRYLQGYLVGLGCTLFAVGISKYEERRKLQVDTLDTEIAEAKFQEWFVKNKTLIPIGNEKFLKWFEKVRELYKKA